MIDCFKNFPFFLLTVFILTAVFFSNSAQASFWDMIRAWVTINPLVVDVSAPKEVEIDKVFRVEAKIINKGGEKIENAKGEIFLPEELKTEKGEEQKIGVLLPYKEKTIFWSVRGAEVGNYVISVKASGKLNEKEVLAEGSTMVKIIEKEFPGREHRFDFFQRLLDFFRERFRF